MMPAEQMNGVQPTILDRLAPLEDGPGEIGSRKNTGTRDAIARDLEMLLNTRRQQFLVPQEFEETRTSIVNFGLPDLTQCGNLRLSSEQAKICRWIEDAIRNFEPRLRNASVRVVDQENVNPVLRFRVEAKAEFDDESVALELALKRDSGKLAVLRKPGS
ncbi:MAG: type VI secretion system baseplate subunit TssE [Acidobacteria bacterium]|nr:type VI secretion system baseplate subunit TssE [Acidobacteriota bacterium]